MADRVKYFLLGVLFLVVAGVIAYDKWNSAGASKEVADRSAGDTGDNWDVSVPPQQEPLKVEPGKEEAPLTPEEQKRLDLPPQPDPSAKGTGGDVPKEAAKTPQPAEPKPVAPAPAPKTHVIKKGETLEAIAIEYYGRGRASSGSSRRTSSLTRTRSARTRS